MKTKSLSLVAACLLGGTCVFAQLDMFKKLKDAVPGNKLPTPTQSQTDTANAFGKMGKAAMGIGPEQEKIIGDSTALEIVGRYGGLVRDPATLHRVNLVGRSLALYSDRPVANWRFGVLNSETVNAFSGPDGYVFITRGLYVLAKNDDELAGILGHEIAHVTGRHALKIVSGSEFWSGAADLAAARSSDVRAVKAAGDKLDVSINKLVTTLFEGGFDPKTEYEADRVGHDLAQTAGYAPGGLRAVLTQLQQRGGDPKKTFATHPPLADRIKRLPDEPAPK